jgi:hypothetical protein
VCASSLLFTALPTGREKAKQASSRSATGQPSQRMWCGGRIASRSRRRRRGRRSCSRPELLALSSLLLVVMVACASAADSQSVAVGVDGDGDGEPDAFAYDTFTVRSRLVALSSYRYCLLKLSGPNHQVVDLCAGRYKSEEPVSEDYLISAFSGALGIPSSRIAPNGVLITLGGGEKCDDQLAGLGTEMLDEIQVTISNLATEVGNDAAGIAQIQVDYMIPNKEFLDELVSHFPHSPEGSAANGFPSYYSAEHMSIPSGGFTVVWPQAEVVVAAPPAVAQGVMTVGGSDFYWPNWAWGLWALLALLCILPLSVFVCRIKSLPEEEVDNSDMMKKKRILSGLGKIHGPEFGLTDLDWDDEDTHRDQTHFLERAYADGRRTSTVHRKPGGSATLDQGTMDEVWGATAPKSASNWRDGQQRLDVDSITFDF